MCVCFNEMYECIYKSSFYCIVEVNRDKILLLYCNLNF